MGMLHDRLVLLADGAPRRAGTPFFMMVLVGALAGLTVAGCAESVPDAVVATPTSSSEAVSAAGLAEAAGCKSIKNQPITADSDALGIIDEVRCTLDGKAGGVSVVVSEASLVSNVALLEEYAYQLPKGTAYVAVGDTWYATTDDASKSFAETFAEANGGRVDSWPAGQ